MPCPVCGSERGCLERQILEDQLITDWEIDATVAAYLNRNQGECCRVCGCNLRSRTLSQYIPGFGSSGQGPLLEINEAGHLHPYLSAGTDYTFAEYPDVRMEQLPYDDGMFATVVHSDTLEHIHDPVKGLAECRRVLRPGGVLVFTVPIVWDGRPSRSRDGMIDSYHGEIYLVAWEFGADFIRFPLDAGFTSVTVTGEYPSSPVFICEK